MFTVVALSPHFPDNFTLFWTRLQAAGARVLGVADAPWEELSPELKACLSEYWRVEDMHNIDELEHACRELQARHGQIDRLESQNEYWLETEAELRSRLGIPGPNRDSIMTLKRKSEMQRRYQEYGVPVPPGGLITSLERAREWVAEAGYPVVAKPDIGVGAALTYKLASDQELEDFWLHKPEVDYFLQGFISGELYSFDGIADAEGKIVFCASHHFNHGIMEVVNRDLDLSYYSLREIPVSLQELGQRVVQAFDVRERFFHFEFFRQGAEQWVALEVNIRPPGGWTTDIMNFTNDIDIYKGYAELLLQGHFPYPAERPWHCAYVGRKSRNYVLSHDQILQRYGEAVVHHAPMAAVFHPVMGVYGYLVRHADLDVLKGMITEMQRCH